MYEEFEGKNDNYEAYHAMLRSGISFEKRHHPYRGEPELLHGLREYIGIREIEKFIEEHKLLIK